MLIQREKSPRAKTGLGRTITIRDGQSTICLDPQTIRTGTLNFISHAHADHLPSRVELGSSAYASQVTAAVALHRTNKTITFRDIDQETPRIIAYDAGHTIGSTQFLINTSTASVLYTGDFCPRKRFFLSGAQPIDCDLLIIESTYGEPVHQFPHPKVILRYAKDWIEDCFARSQVPVLVGYSFGKAQLLCAFLEKISVKYVVHPAIAQINGVLGRFGYDFKGQILTDPSSRKLVLSEDIAIVSPRRLPQRYQNPKSRYYYGYFTGQSFFSKASGTHFLLSDHADFDDLIRHINGCNPDKVLCFLYPGSKKARILAQHVERITGIEAISLDDPISPQKKLRDYLVS